MARKSNKVEIKNSLITEENGEFLVKYIDEETEQEMKANLSDQIRKFINTENTNFKVGKGRNSSGAGRKPTFKYVCHGCERVVKSAEEDLAIKCMKCNKDFEKQE